MARLTSACTARAATTTCAPSGPTNSSTLGKHKKSAERAAQHVERAAQHVTCRT
jgi:hypothetical protein